jgi:hypothetical protein
MTEQPVVIGIFEDRRAVKRALAALKQAGFHDEQLGFAARSDHPTEGQTESEQPPQRARAILKGIVGGILGAADILLIPFTGPADAGLILESALPSVEGAIDSYPRRTSGQLAEAPKAAATGQEEPQTETAIAEGEEGETEEKRTSSIAGGVVGGVAGAAAALFIPGIGPIVAAGTLAAILSGAALGSVAGGFLGAFERIGVPEHQAHHYERAFRAGQTIVTVKAGIRQQEAQDILRRYGAHDVQVH